MKRFLGMIDRLVQIDDRGVRPAAEVGPVELDAVPGDRPEPPRLGRAAVLLTVPPIAASKLLSAAAALVRADPGEVLRGFQERIAGEQRHQGPLFELLGLRPTRRRARHADFPRTIIRLRSFPGVEHDAFLVGETIVDGRSRTEPPGPRSESPLPVHDQSDTGKIRSKQLPNILSPAMPLNLTKASILHTNKKTPKREAFSR